MSLPEIQANANLNLTVIISVTVFCVSTMATIINLFGAKRAERMKEKEEAKRQKDTSNTPGKSLVCQQHEKNVVRIEDLTKDNTKKIEDAQKIVNEMRTQVATLENDKENMHKTIDEMKDNNKEIARRLDDLLKQLMDWMND